MNKITLIAIAIGWCVCAQCDYSIALTNMIDGLQRPHGTLDAAFTNQLVVYAEELTNVSQSANVNLVRAISLADIAEEDVNGDEMLPPAIAICSNILNSTELPSAAWQKGVAGIVMTGINTFEGKRSNACSSATNVTVLSSHNISLEEDLRLWNSIASHLDVEGLSVQDAVRCYAAIALLNDNPSCGVSSYTNGLPESILIKIREFCE